MTSEDLPASEDKLLFQETLDCEEKREGSSGRGPRSLR